MGGFGLLVGGAGWNGVAPVLVLAAGTGVVAFVLRVFLRRGGYADWEEFPDSVEHEHLRRVAGSRVAALCPGAIRLAEKERAGTGSSDRGSVPAREFWRRFAAASASVDEDPVAALREMRGLPELLEEALLMAGRGTGVAGSVPGREDGR